MKAAIVWCEDVHRDECVIGKEAGFDGRGRAVVDQLAGERDALGDGSVRQVYENATGKSASCQRTDLCSLIKAILKHLIGLELEGVRLVDFPPEQLMALRTGGVAGLGKAVRHGSECGGWVGQSKCLLSWPGTMRRTLWVALFGIAMAAVEAAVVVYLRALHTGAAPLSVLQYELPTRLLAIEVAREAATLVMLIPVAAVASRNTWEGLLYFALAFGLWDIFYYVWLWVFIGRPPWLFTWDVMFLVPVL